MPLKSYEDIMVFYKKNPLYNPQGIIKINKKSKRIKDKETTVYSNMGLKSGGYIQEYTNYPKDIIKTDKNIFKTHPTQKPVELLSYLIKTYTKPNDLILDFTAGSFTTCVASEQLNRRSIGIELEKKYCDIGIKRLSNLQMRLDI